MFLNEKQITKVESVFMEAGLNKNDFVCHNGEIEIVFHNVLDPTYRFQIKESIQGANFGDVFCEPYTYIPHIYKRCNSFDECLHIAKEWAIVVKYNLAGKPYYHKVFISHSSKDKVLVDEFVDKVLRLSCDINTSDIVYTSRETTGVEPGNGIPSFIKENLRTSSIILFMISENYKKSEVCLCEMGAAWAMEKKTISILLPNVSFHSLGWLTSLDKAIKIGNNEGLDKLYTMLNRNAIDVIDWNRQKASFLTFCRSRVGLNDIIISDQNDIIQ